MSYCGNCGNPVTPDLAYCPNCGAENPEYAAPAPAEIAPMGANEPLPYAPAYEPADCCTRSTNGLAIAGFVLAFVFPPVGIILSAMACKRAKSGEYRNPLPGLAKAGLIISIIGTVLLVLYVIFAVVFFGYIFENYGSDLSYYLDY